MKRDTRWPAPDERRALLLERKRSKMAESAEAFVRGSSDRFYEWLSESAVPPPDGPFLWICGDCHVGNLGPLEDSAGDVAIQIRDLDQSIPANPCFDLIRLGLSLAMIARGARLPGVATAAIVGEILAGYAAGLLGEPEADQRKSPKSVRFVLQEAKGRSWSDFLADNLRNTKPTIPLGSRFWPLTDEEHEAIAGVFESDRVRRLLTSLYSRDDDATIEVADAAYWVKGCSSLGGLRIAVLVKVTGESIGKGKLALMDLKEAVAAHAPRRLPAAIPVDDAERVVAGARRVSPYLGERMEAIRLFETPVFMRELLPEDLRIDIERLSEKEAKRVSRHLARVIGRAHASQLQAPDRLRWAADISRSESKSAHAPSWLWTNVVALAARHEAAYLEHCRRYASSRENQSDAAHFTGASGDAHDVTAIV